MNRLRKKSKGKSKNSAKAVKREVYSKTILPQETRKTLNRQPNFTPKTTGKRKTNKQRLNNMFLNNEQVTEEIKREIK